MSDDEDYNSEEDVDYIPSEGEQVSEEENSGDEEDVSGLLDDDTLGDDTSPTKGRGRKYGAQKKKNLISSRKRKGGIQLVDKSEAGAADPSLVAESEEEAKRRKELAEQIAQEEEERRKEKERKRVEDLWNSFKSDVKVPSRSSAGSGLGSLTSQVKSSSTSDLKAPPVTAVPEASTNEKSKKVTITKVFDFAGEEIKITKEVDADSKEAKAEQKKLEKSSMEQTESPSATLSTSVGLGVKRPSAGGGLGSVLNKITKKNKMGTLEKSKIDWDVFKRKEGIDDDLKIHNKGKQGYTERMAFLNRTDQRQYEIERALRLGNNSKR